MLFVSADSIDNHTDVKSCTQQKSAFVVFTRTFRSLQKLWMLLVGFEARLLIQHNLTRLWAGWAHIHVSLKREVLLLRLLILKLCQLL